ncbi:hypothetical protein FEM48_Zijuj12G0088200 [Ziziphus jujuba var. spinosa]|uniref:Transposase MuDR plant domain-containing protein n=1 Tax=Ziziphus jujuba var. spinosa TaxID=714518 RepID=A0A978UCB9_ZIZJJ|nr:hypothetical protein FEM48_Zijuj12G0088200 [Ziziphus jujuba var. spinosa]
MGHLSNGPASEVLPSSGYGVWKVKLMIDTKQVEETFSKQGNTKALIEKMRMVTSSASLKPRHAKSFRDGGGKARIFEKFDPDTANIIYLRDMVKEMGYNKFKLCYLQSHSILQWGVKPLETDGDALKLAELGSKHGAIDVYIEHKDIDGNEQADGAVQSPLDEPVLSPLDETIDSLLNSPIDEPVDDETKRVNDARKNVRNCAGRKNRSNGAGSSSANAKDGHAKGSNEETVGVAPASGYKNGKSMGEVHWDSDELVSLASSNKDRDTLTIPTYSSMGDQLELYVGMKFSSQAAFREYLVDFTLKGGYNNKFIKSASRRITTVCEGACPWRLHASNMKREETF